MLGHTNPSPRKIATLKDGFWEETALYESPQGNQVVRKTSKARGKSGPWARQTLRKEIRYLKQLPLDAAPLFPPVLRSWGENADDTGETGYEIPFYSDRINLAERLTHEEIDRNTAALFQTKLADCLFDRLYLPVPREMSLASHVRETLSEAIGTLATVTPLENLIQGREIVVNERPGPGLERLWQDLGQIGVIDRLDEGPWVKLHGDLILENILCPRKGEAPWWEDLVFIDPVSVAGVAAGPPLFDLVKYESYATGELPAIRSEWCTAGPEAPGRYRFAWDHEHPVIAPYRDGVWRTTFRQCFENRFGPVDEELYHLLDAYFSLVMAVNTQGIQQWARVLKGILALRLVFA